MSQSEPSVAGSNRHHEYYWGSIKFKVGDTYLKLRKRPFITESDEFPRLYGLSFEDDTEDTDMIELDVNLTEFESFLKGLCPESSFYKDKPELSRDEWTSVLKLSSKWLFNDLRKVAITKLTNVAMSPIERVCLAKEYKVSSWLLTGYIELAERPDIFTEEEAEQIDWRTALKLSGVIIRRCRGGWSRTLDLKTNILEAFKPEFEAVKEDERKYMTKQDSEVSQIGEEKVEQGIGSAEKAETERLESEEEAEKERLSQGERDEGKQEGKQRLKSGQSERWKGQPKKSSERSAAGWESWMNKFNGVPDQQTQGTENSGNNSWKSRQTLSPSNRKLASPESQSSASAIRPSIPRSIPVSLFDSEGEDDGFKDVQAAMTKGTKKKGRSASKDAS